MFKFKNNKNILLIALLYVSLPLTVLAESEVVKFNLPTPQINARSYVLMDYHTGAVLAEKNANGRYAPASLTKMMTSYVVGDAIRQGKIRNDDVVTISNDAWGKNFPGSSKMFLNVNQQVKVGELNHGVIIASGNDACVALAEYLVGSQQAFIDLMNKYVKQFGLKNTHFRTVHGLDADGQYSSAYDMAVIGAHLIRDLPSEYEIYSQKDFTFNNITQKNRNGLLWDKNIQVDGIKTGHTDEAGYNLVASAVNGSTRLISVVMGVDTYKGREIESKKLLQWGFNNFETLQSFKANTVVSEQPVYYGVENTVKLGALQDRYITIPRGKMSELKARYELNNKVLEAPLVKGQVVGKIIYQLDGKDVATVDLQVLEPVKEAGFFGWIIDWIIVTVKNLFS